MKQATKQKGSAEFAEQIKHRMREGAMLVISAIAIFLIVSLCTYHSTDPGWSATGFDAHVQNAGGRAGAWFSDFFLYMFGYLAYIFPLLVCYGAWLAWKDEHDEDKKNKHFLVMRFIGFIFIMVTGTALADLLLPNVHAHLPYAAGGILGDFFGQALAKLFNVFGSVLLLFALLLAGVTLFTGISWVKLSKVFMQLLAKLLQYSSSKSKIALDTYKEKRAIKKEENRKPEIITHTPQLEKKVKKAVVETSVAISEQLAVIPKSSRAEKERQLTMFGSGTQKGLPGLGLLDNKKLSKYKGISKEFLAQQSREVEQRLKEFGVTVKVVAVHPGPVITRYEMELAPGIKVSKITGLAKDLARSLSTVSVRVVEVIPGKAVVGLELPNEHREIVCLKEVLESQQYEQARSKLSLGLGKDIAGHPVIVDLAKMPHLLAAGTTGSGKSVALNVMLLSLLYKATPEDVRMILVDPKMLELSVYEDIPHLLAPVVTDMKEAGNALKWCVAEMDRRYQLMSALGVRNLAGYNAKVKEALEKGEPIKHPLIQADNDEDEIFLEPLPSILVLIDEFADMIMVVGKKVEELIARLAQKARAAGIHLILATQRPSVDVITGLIKANIPTRIAFQVSSKIDSRTIIDQQGAEQLLGHGDMLYLPPCSGIPVRVHGAFVADDEVHRVVAELKKLGKPNYLDEIIQGGSDTDGNSFGDEGDSDLDELFDHAVEFVTQSRKVSISSVQRRFKIGYNRAARIVEDMERNGIVSAMESNGSREVLAPPPVES